MLEAAKVQLTEYQQKVLGTEKVISLFTAELTRRLDNLASIAEAFMTWVAGSEEPEAAADEAETETAETLNPES